MERVLRPQQAQLQMARENIAPDVLTRPPMNVVVAAEGRPYHREGKGSCEGKGRT